MSLGPDSCFTNLLFEDEGIQRLFFEVLYDLLVRENELRPRGSYTTFFSKKAVKKILKKSWGRMR
jgi:hypothetical protein